MVYESGFTTRRTYTSRPVVTSYAVSYPTVTRVSRVYKTSYPIHSTKSYTCGKRILSPAIRIVTSPVRVTRTTTTVSLPERISSYIHTTPTIYYSSYTPHILSYIPSYPTPYIPSTYSSPVTRIYPRSVTPVSAKPSAARVTPSYLKRIVPGYGTRALNNYLGTEPFTTFREETGRIRHRAQSLMRDLHAPIIRRPRSMTPFPVIGYEPYSDVAFDAYVSRITNPVRHIAKEVHRMSMFPEPAHIYFDPELDPYRPSRKFSTPRLLEDPFDDESKEKQRLRHERFMTINENELDNVEVEKKNDHLNEEAETREEKDLYEKVKRKEEKSVRQPEEAACLAEEERKEQAKGLKPLAAIKKQAEETKDAERKDLEEEQRRTSAEEERTRLEQDAQLAEEIRTAENSRKAEEARLVGELRLAKEAEEEALKAAEVARFADEQRIREAEIKRLDEIKKQAQEDREAELARQAAELVEIAQQEAEISIQEQQNIQKFEHNTTVYPEEQQHQQQEPTININISSGGTDDVHVSTEEETEEE